MSETEQKAGFFGRTGRNVRNYGANRIMSKTSRQTAVEIATRYSDAAVSAIKPVKLERHDILAGHIGRYEDGGAKRFAELMEHEGLTQGDLSALTRQRQRLALIYLCGSVIFIGLAFFTAFTASPGAPRLGAVAFFTVSMATLAVALRHDFCAWQIKKQGFPGFKAYLHYRLG